MITSGNKNELKPITVLYDGKQSSIVKRNYNYQKAT